MGIHLKDLYHFIDELDHISLLDYSYYKQLIVLSKKKCVETPKNMRPVQKFLC